ncbi:MAG TPA: hypothetical protein VGM23_05385 [Armatimonadota bacterium]|jgi:hypothetical protein
MGKAARELSPEAQRVMVRELRAGKTARMIAGIIAQEVGEDVAERTLSRRISEWRSYQQRRHAAQEQMETLLAAAKAQDATAPEMIRALGIEALMMDPDAWSGSDPIKVQRQNLQAEELRIKRERLEIQKRQVAVDEARLRIMLDREKRAVAALEDKGEAMTPEERIREIRAIYGLKNGPETTN